MQRILEYQLLVGMRSIIDRNPRHYRFKVEEMYMRRNNDPDLPTHREQHRLFMKNMAYCWLEIMEKHKQISVEFCDYLTEWLDFHTRNLDSKLKPHS